jgi:hypothetical protein
MNFVVTNNRLKLSNGYDVSGSVNTNTLLVGTNQGITPSYVLDVSTNNVNAVKMNNTFYLDGSNNRVSIGKNFSNASYTFDVSGETRIQTDNIRIGRNAGNTGQGTSAVAIGTGAGQTNQLNNSIVINATGSILNGDLSNALFIKPIRNNTNTNFLSYDISTGEITYQSSSSSSISNLYGNGANGTATISTDTSLNGDVYYSNLTINAGITLFTAGYRIFCSGTLTNNGTISFVGNNASGSTPGTTLASSILGGGGAGALGQAVSNGAGIAPPNSVWSPTVIDCRGGNGGAGAFGGGAGGSTVATINVTTANGGSNVLSSYTQAIIGKDLAGIQIKGGNGGASGGCEFDGTASGGGGSGGGVILICAKTIVNSGTITVRGGTGGAALGNSGGGGGGGGGTLIIITSSTSVGGTISVAGGAGGAGGNNGSAGNSGRLITFYGL